MDSFEQVDNMSIAEKTEKPTLDVSDTAVNAVRCKMRILAEIRRSTKRHEANDISRCGLGEITEMHKSNKEISVMEIVDLSAKLRTRREATCEELSGLSRAFISGEQHIVAFMSTPGAFQVIIKELTGRRADRELSALQCICNLSLGNAQVCEKIIAYAGCYLSVIIEGGSYEMKCTALWTLANIISTSDRCVQKLVKMNIMTTLLNLYVNSDARYPYISSAAGLCLYLLSLKGASYLNAEHKSVIYVKAHFKNPYTDGAEYFFAILLLTGLLENNCGATVQHLIYLVVFIAHNIDYCDDLVEEEHHLRVFYTVRALGKLIQSQPLTFNILQKELSYNRLKNFYSFTQKLVNFNNSLLNVEIKWMLEIINSYSLLKNEELSQFEELFNNVRSVAME